MSAPLFRLNLAVEDVLYPWLGSYWHAPRWLKASAGRLYTWLPRQYRLGSAYYHFHQELAAASDPDCARRIARSKLSETLSWAIETVPEYERFQVQLRSAQEPSELLASLPVIDKTSINRHPERYLSQAIPATRRLKAMTSGSNQNPLCFYLQKHVTRPKEQAFIQQFHSRVGATSLKLTLSLRGRPIPGPRAANGAPWLYEPIKRQLIFGAGHLDERGLPHYAQLLERYRPAFIEAFPSLLYPLARWLKDHPVSRWEPSLQGVLLYSENVYGFQMRLFRQVFRCPVLKHYGHSERVLMAGSMPDDERYFFWPTYGWFELLDARDRPVTEPGVLGHIVGTSFDNRAMPFVRYRTGDLAVLSGRGHPQLPGHTACERIEGRVQEFVIDRDHRAISIANVCAQHIPAFSRIDAMQYHQDRAGELTLKFVTRTPLAPEERRRMARAVSEKSGCDVTVVRVDALEGTARGKHRMLIQHLDVGRHFGVDAAG
jgi:phenylacetate-CoA ligase